MVPNTAHALQRPYGYGGLLWDFDVVVHGLPRAPRLSEMLRTSPVKFELSPSVVAFALHSDARGFGAVVGMTGFSEPGMLQGLFGRYPLRGVIDEYLFQQVQKVREERRRRRDDVLSHVSQATQQEGHAPPTSSFFMALTNRREARVVSVAG